MKRLTLWIAIFMVIAPNIVATGQVIERPVHGLTDTGIIEIDKVETTGDATLFYLNIYWLRRPFSFGADVTVRAAGKIFDVIAVEEITETNGKNIEEIEPRIFRLRFPRLPENTVSVDLAGTATGGRFKIYGIDLTGKAPQYRPQLPEAAFTASRNQRDELPAPILRIAETTVNLHLTGLEDGFEVAPLVMGTVNPFTGESKQIEPVETSPGVYTFKVEKYATGKNGITINGSGLSVLSNPGEQVEIWVDMAAMNLRKSKLRANSEMRWVYFEGDFADVNNDAAHAPDALDPRAGQFPRMAFHLDRNGISVENYIKGMMRKIDDETAAIMAVPGLSGEVRQARIMEMKTKCLRAVKEMKIMLSTYRRDDDPALENNTHLLYLLKDAGLNDPKLLYGSEFPLTISEIAAVTGQAGITDEVSCSQEGWMYDWQVYPVLRKVETRQPVTPEDEAVIATASPYYRELFAHLKKKTEDEYTAALGSGKFAIRETPEYDNMEDLLQNIVNQYPGKVVFVDFWATWCGPCLNAMRMIRPLKPEMKDHGVVSVYITFDSSPKTKWTLSLPDIGGEHYYLTLEEWRVILEKYGFTGIPTYMIFDKAGKHSYQATGFPGVDKLRGEFEKLW